MQRRLRHPVIAVLAALASAGAAGTLGAQGHSAPPTPVEIAVVERESLAETLEVVGTLRADESVTIRPELSGRIEAIGFKEGTRVTKGSVLFELDDALLHAELNEAQANLARSQRASQRGQELSERKLIAQSDLDEVKATLAVDRARTSSASTRMEKMRIRAPFDGITGLRQVSIGEYVNAGDPLVQLVRTDPIEVDFSVPELHVARLRVGQPVSLAVDAFAGERFHGEVSAIAPVIDSGGRNVTLRASLPNPSDRLVPGQFARVSLALDRDTEALVIPEQALWPVRDKTYVFRVADGIARQVEVTTGARRPGRVRVLSGLALGDVVVSAGQLKLSDGSPVHALNPEILPPGDAGAATPQ